MLIWTDFETTGLDPFAEHVLEIGAIATNDSFEEVSRFHCVISTTVDMDAVDPYVLDMHTKNGLWDSVTHSDTTHVDAAAAFLAWVKTHVDKGKAPLCGSSVHFDRGFMKVHFPDVNDWLHYRNIDVSTLKELGKRVGWPAYDGPIDKRHRAMDDIEHSMRELDHYLSNM